MRKTITYFVWKWLKLPNVVVCQQGLLVKPISILPVNTCDSRLCCCQDLFFSELKTDLWLLFGPFQTRFGISIHNLPSSVKSRLCINTRAQFICWVALNKVPSTSSSWLQTSWGPWSVEEIMMARSVEEDIMILRMCSRSSVMNKFYSTLHRSSRESSPAQVSFDNFFIPSLSVSYFS